jgi:hypothetical protein
MAFAGVHDQHTGLTRRVQHGRNRLDRARELADVVTERLAETTRLHEIALHVDDEKRGRCPVEHDRPRLRCELS